MPTLSAAAVPADGATVALTFSGLFLIFQPAYSSAIRNAFTVTVDGTESQTTDFAVSGATATLTMSDTIGEDQAVIVSYDRSPAGREALGTGRKILVANFTTGENSVPAVVNNAEVDTSPPELTGATVTSSGDAIVLAFGEDLDLPATIPAALKDAFSVTADGDTVEISGLAADGSSGLQINLSSKIMKDQAVVVSYDRSAAGTNALDDADGNEVASLTTGSGAIPAVDNNSTVAPATVTSATVNASGTVLNIEFDKQINNPLGFAALFSLTVDGVGHGVGSLQFGGGDQSIGFLLPSPIATGQAVVLSYAKPADSVGLTTNDAEALPVASFTTGEDGVPAVDNNSAVAQATITEVAVTSTPRAATDTYGEGETIEVTVTFSEAVTATTGTDFVLSVAGAKRAPLVRGSGTATLVFGYTVLAGDSDDDGIWIGDQSRTLVGNRNGDPQNGTITSVATRVAADLTHSQRGEQSGHKVNGSLTTPRPTLKTGTQVRPDGARLYMTFTEDVSTMLPPKSAFTVTAGGSPVTIGSIARPAGASIELRGLSPLIGDNETVRLAYRDPTTGNDINAIQNIDGVDASSFSAVSVNNNVR